MDEGRKGRELPNVLLPLEIEADGEEEEVDEATEGSCEPNDRPDLGEPNGKDHADGDDEG